jgi:hypothetical protein
VNEFAVGVVTGVEVGTIAEAFISILVDDGSEVFAVA